MKPYRLLLTLILFTLPLDSLAGLKWVLVGVDGLTCSMCSRSVEMSLKRLDFVDKVTMSLEETEGRIYFKEGQPIDFKKIAKAIVAAGFSVRFMRLEFDFTDLPVNANGAFIFQHQVFQWLQFKPGFTSGEVSLKLIDQDFVARSEKTSWKKKIEASAGSSDQKIFHVVVEN